MSSPSSLTGLLMYGALETLLNQALTGDERGREQLAALDGTVVRLRGESPMWVLYVLIYEDGVELLSDYEGPVDVRVRGALGAMLHWLLAPNSGDAEHSLRITGPDDTLERLQATISEFSLWPLVRNWLDDHVRLRELLSLLRREDPAWLEKLAGIPDHLGELAAQVARQQLLQEDILEEVRGLRPPRSPPRSGLPGDRRHPHSGVAAARPGPVAHHLDRPLPRLSVAGHDQPGARPHSRPALAPA